MGSRKRCFTILGWIVSWLWLIELLHFLYISTAGTHVRSLKRAAQKRAYSQFFIYIPICLYCYGLTWGWCIFVVPTREHGCSAAILGAVVRGGALRRVSHKWTRSVWIVKSGTAWSGRISVALQYVEKTQMDYSR